MNERRDDLSTADLAAQQPTDTAPPDRTEGTGFERRDVTADDPGREERRPDDLPRDAAVLEDRVADVEPGRDPLRQDQDGAAEVGVDQELAPMPNGAPTAQVAPDSGAADTTSTAGPLLASEDAEGFRARWTDVQTGFVDAPRQAVERADGLVAELMQHLASTFADERGRLETQWDRGDDVPTDDLRTAFQRYRSFFERLLAT
jgi:hypothetical protein